MLVLGTIIALVIHVTAIKRYEKELTLNENFKKSIKKVFGSIRRFETINRILPRFF